MALAILVVLIINALVGFLTEWQANRALDALRRRTLTTARVRREGIEITVDARELVPGDIIILGIVLGPVVLAITLGLLATFKHDGREEPLVSAPLPFEICRPTKRKPMLGDAKSL